MTPDAGPVSGGGRASAADRATELIASLIAASLALIAVAWAADAHRSTGLGHLYTEQMIAVVLGHALALAFLSKPWRAGARRSAADLVLAALGLGGAIYLTVRYPVLSTEMFYHPVEALALAALLFVLVVEALRRTVGWSLVAVLAAFVAYGLLADIMPGKLQGKAMLPGELVVYVVLDGSAMLGAPLLIAVTVVLAFILFGALLERSGGSEFFTDFCSALLGRSRGGSAKIAVVASSLFGSISGSAVANVAATGVVTIPLMTRAGYPPAVAGAIEAVASTGGQLMPPIMGAAAFLMAEFLNTPYQTIVIAAIVPALLYFAAVFIYADLEAVRRGITAVEASRIVAMRRVIADGWHFTLPFAVLLALLFALDMRAEKAALAACLTLIALTVVRDYGGRRLGLAATWRAITAMGRTSVEIVIVCAVAGMIIGILGRSGLDFSLSFILIQFGQHSLALLLAATAVVAIVLGMGMPTTGVYLLLATLAAPPLVKLGVDPLAAHMFVFYFGMMSMITPPVALAAFTAANIAQAGPMRTGWIAMRFAWPAYLVPFLFVFSPTLLMKGATGAVALDVATALLGIYAATAGMAGHALGRLAAGERALLVPAGLALLLPANTFSGAGYVNIAGGAAAILVLGWHAYRRRTAAPSAAMR